MLTRVSRVLLAAALLAPGCRSEPPEAAMARAKKALMERQISGLEEMLERTRKEGLSKDRVFVGLSEDVFREVVKVTLPQEVVLKDKIRLRMERAEPYFRYSKAVVVFDGRLSALARPDLFITVRLAGGIDAVRFEAGRLSALVKLYYFEVQDSALGSLSKAVVEQLVRDNMGLLTDAIPPIEIPVHLDDGISIAGLGDGPVSVRPGTLPFTATVARISTFNSRLWIGLDLSAGPWKVGGHASAPDAKAPAKETSKPGVAPQGGGESQAVTKPAGPPTGPPSSSTTADPKAPR